MSDQVKPRPAPPARPPAQWPAPSSAPVWPEAAPSGTPNPVVYRPRPPARRPGRTAQFLKGYALGLAGGVLVLFAALWLFPPPRTNILLLGLDRRPGEESFVSRTDTMMLVTVFPASNYVGMLSIPRDLYLTLPDGRTGRVNTAHFFAEADAPGTGPEAAMNTVRSNFGVDVHNYVRMDLIGFVKIVDAVGGIEVDVPARMVDYEYPTYDYGITTVVFEAGPQHMNGEQALAYARIRHGSSDFQRAARQQVVIAALLKRLAHPGAWPRFPALLAAVAETIDTDLSPFELMRLAPAVLRVGPDNLDRRVIEGPMVQPYTTESGGAVQLPVWERINPVLLEMFGQ